MSESERKIISRLLMHSLQVDSMLGGAVNAIDDGKLASVGHDMASARFNFHRLIHEVKKNNTWFEFLVKESLDKISDGIDKMEHNKIKGDNILTG